MYQSSIIESKEKISMACPSLVQCIYETNEGRPPADQSLLSWDYVDHVYPNEL
jgi:hypothetical protein